MGFRCTGMYLFMPIEIIFYIIVNMIKIITIFTYNYNRNYNNRIKGHGQISKHTESQRYVHRAY